jgi:hypothetical protein
MWSTSLLTDDEIVARAKTITDARKKEAEEKARVERFAVYKRESERINAKLKAAIEATLLCDLTEKQLDDILDAVNTYREEQEWL